MRARILGVVLALVANVARGANAAEFERKLARVRERVQAGDGTGGERALAALLEAHREKPYVRARRDEIVALHKRCLFRRTCPPPDPRTLVDGDLLSWNRDTGQIRLRYKSTRGKDFSKQGKFRIHQVAFRGPHTITVTGDIAILLLCATPERGYLFRSDVHRIVVSRKGKGKLLARAQRDTWPKLPGELRIQVGAKEITVSSGGEVYLRAQKQASVWGHFGIESETDHEVRLEGEAEPGWLEALIDTATQEQWSRFESGYHAESHLPLWLFARAGGGAAPPRSTWWPNRSAEGDRAARMLGAGEFKAALGYVEGLPETALQPAHRALLRGRALLGLERLEESLEAYRKAGRLAPSFVRARIREAALLLRLRRGDEALEEADRLLAEFPDNGDAHASKALLLLTLDRMEKARALLSAAIERGVTSPGLLRYRSIVDRAVLGPSWPRVFEHRSARYHVRSDIDAETCRQAVATLESAFLLFAGDLGWPAGQRGRFRVYLFSGQAGFRRYCEELKMGVRGSAAGVYQPLLRQLLIWSPARRELMLRTIRHEGFHQFLHRVMPDAPVWLNEGLAEYYESAVEKGGRWGLGAVRMDHLRNLDGKVVPLREFLFLSARGFMANPPVHYAQAWGFVHYLRHDKPELFKGFWKGCRSIPSNRKSVETALAGTDLEALEKDFRRYLELLPLRSRR